MVEGKRAIVYFEALMNDVRFFFRLYGIYTSKALVGTIFFQPK